MRARIEDAWGARTFDHAGATEVGAWGFMCDRQDGLHVNEAEFIAEVLDPATGSPVNEGEMGELVVTNLGRPGWPAIRYRTGDLVRAGGRRCPCGRTWLSLPGGVVGRADDLIVVRGVNIYPSAIEAIVRDCNVDEFRIVRLQRHEMDELLAQVEAADGVAETLAGLFRNRLGVRIDVEIVPRESLPRFELKARRVADQRSA